jgi:predicted TIM-barrel fold metal-dependent hydrolase
MKKSAPEPEPCSPIYLGPISNGEVPPEPRTREHDLAEDLYRRVVEEKSRRLGISRRRFIDSSCGMLAAFWVMDQVAGCNGDGGMGTAGGSGGGGGSGGSGGPDGARDQAAMANQDGGYDVPKDALEDQAQADAILAGDEFIFDVQVHNRVPAPPWNASICQARNPQVCPTDFLREIFVASDTDVACLSGYPNDVPSIQARDGLRRMIDMVQGAPRLKIHCNIRPWLTGAALDAELDAAEQNARMFQVAAWKMYGDDQGGRGLHQVEPRVFERLRAIGVKTLCAHRGLRQAGGPGYMDVYSPRDIVAAAKAHPDFNFLVYHSGFEGDGAVPYNDANPAGVDRLIKAMREFEIGPNGNVYAELGSTWRGVMTNPARATHLLGKLLLHLGPDRILWGTDSLNIDNPSGQIAAFRTFQMNQAIRDMFQYPALTDEVKRKIFGLNGARVYGVDPAVTRRKLTNDDLSQLRLAWKDDRRSVPLNPHRPHGPRTWREYLGFRRWNGEAV